MAIVSAAVGVVLILIVLGDAFETIVLPRRVTRRVRLARIYYRFTWMSWVRMIRWLFAGKRQATYLSFYGPLSLIVLLMLWATGLIIGFGLIHWGSGSIIKSPYGAVSFGTYLYLSGTTFFTLGIGDVVPVTTFGRGLVAFEAGMGFGFLALVIGYLPVLNQSFSRREVNISLLDARAGSPPTAGELLRRHSHDRGMEELRQLFHEWERWSAELLESHLSYPVLAYYRSQHDNLSWLEALTAILDASAFVTVVVGGPCERQAQLTFAITRHAIVDLAQIFSCKPHHPKQDRLSPDKLEALQSALSKAGMKLRKGRAVEQRLSVLRRMYEPYVYSLSQHVHIPMPPWVVESHRADDWQTSAWGRSTGFQIEDPSGKGGDEHF
jgi:voltage-gated potassium channel Kch